MSYRHEARESLKRAKVELDGGENDRLKYAALELRMAMESLTFDRAASFKDEFPPDEYETWQPRKVMALLLEIDATADKDSTLSVGLEGSPGEPPVEMSVLGAEKVLNMETIRNHYDALSSFLHVPTLKQTKSGKMHDMKKLRVRCMEIACSIEDVLASSVHNVRLGNYASIECHECGKVIRKRMPRNAESVECRCFSCVASYTIKSVNPQQVFWDPQVHDVKCGGDNCDHKISIWRREIVVGAS